MPQQQGMEGESNSEYDQPFIPFLISTLRNIPRYLAYCLVFVIIIVGLSFFVNATTNTYCYQESANTSNQTGIDGNCGLNYTGIYNFTFPGSTQSWTNPENLIDGNWSSFGVDDTSSTGVPGYLQINYTKPLNSDNNSKWKLNDFSTEYNLPSECWNYDSTKLVFLVKSFVRTSFPLNANRTFYCYNGSNYNTIFQEDGSGSIARIYEEGMNWSITYNNPSSPTINKPTNTTISANNEKLQINYSASTPDTGLSITDYNITLVDTLGNYVKTINSSLTGTNFNWTVNVSNGGSYKVRVNVIDNNSGTNYSLSDTFIIYDTTLNITAKDNYSNTQIYNFTITPSGTNWYNVTSLTTTTGNVSLYTFYNYSLLINITSNNYAPNSYIHNTNTSYYNYTFMLNPAGSLFVTITNQINGSVITGLTNLTLRSSTYNNATSTTNGYYNFTSLGSGDYVLTVKNVNYTTSDFYVTMASNSYQTINARLLPNATNSSIGIYIKSSTYQELPNTTITIQRQYLGGSWATTNMLTTDENGYVTAQLQEGEIYRFIIQSQGYSIKQFDQPVYAALSPYTFLLTSTTEGLYTDYWSGVNYYYYPTNTQLSRGVYNFTLTVYNSTKDISWVSVNANGNIVNVTSSPSGGTASYTDDLSNYTGVYPVTYTFYFYDNVAQKYTYLRIPVNYYVNTYNLSQTTINQTLSDIKDDITSGNSGMGNAWTVIIATFLILVIMITLIQISGQPILGVIGGVIGTGFFAYVGWINPVYASITCILIVLMLAFNR